MGLTDFGTNGGLMPARPLTVPEGTDICLVSFTRYNERGEAVETIDALGLATRQEFDDAGQLVKTIENYVAEPQLFFRH